MSSAAYEVQAQAPYLRTDMQFEGGKLIAVRFSSWSNIKVSLQRRACRSLQLLWYYLQVAM